MIRDPAPRKFLLPGGYDCRAKRRGPPLRSTRELADEFGVTANQLAALIRTTSIKAPTLRHTTARDKWYEPNEVRTWWASDVQARQAK